MQEVFPANWAGQAEVSSPSFASPDAEGKTKELLVTLLLFIQHGSGERVVAVSERGFADTLESMLGDVRANKILSCVVFRRTCVGRHLNETWNRNADTLEVSVSVPGNASVAILMSFALTTEREN